MSSLKPLCTQTQESLDFFNSELFKTVQVNSVFTDSKTFADAVPKEDYNHILHQYHIEKSTLKEFNLMWLLDFIHRYFDLPDHKEISLQQRIPSIEQHIDTLWDTLSKKEDSFIAGSLLPLKESYIVPGGRFREVYYWDTYFTALGLIESNRLNIVESMLNNFIDIQERFGCIPNGNRSYYLSRSQPPILGLLVELLLPYQDDPNAFIATKITALEAEYQFWMQGAENLENDTHTEYKRVVKMPDGSILNRYWDDNTSPRPESYREDIELLEQTQPEDSAMFYRNIRAACESGWDFSSRWLAEGQSLASIKTTRIVPVDLNCLLYKLESLISEYANQLGDIDKSNQYANKAQQRKLSIEQFFWSSSEQFYMDFDLDKQQPHSIKSLAGALPLYVKIASVDRASHVATLLETQFLKEGGLVTTLVESGQQWDSPNGWAPLHWFTVQGLYHYNHQALAEKIMGSWLATCEHFFEKTGKMMEKYDVCNQTTFAQGGEYDVQEGFGWTNGVYKAFSASFVAK